MAIPHSQPARISRLRIDMLLLAMLLIGALCIGKLVEVQVTRHEELSSLAEGEIERTETLLPRRGLIRDGQGTVLAMNIDRDSLWVAPHRIREPEKLALILSPLLGMSVPEVHAGLISKQRYLRLARWLSPEASEQIRRLEEPGLDLIPEPRRVYPLGSSAAHIVGVSNWEGHGISGVEAYHDDLLTGVTGMLQAERDPQMRPIALKPRVFQPPRHGADLTLTIDPTVQKIVEEALKQGIEQNSATGGSVTVLDPDTGAILGIASWPYFDPNHYNDYPPEVYNQNEAITKVYEPGSTFKIIVAAIGLDSGAFTANTTVNDTGAIMRYGWPIHNWNYAGHGPITPADVLYYSSNVGAVQLAEMIGAERFYEYLRRFGYGQMTGVDLAGEQMGIVQWPDQKDWSPIVLDTNGYGHGISVTPLQHLRAIAAVANGGRLMDPYVVREWCEDEFCHEIKPKVVGQVISNQTTELIRPMLVRAANTYARVIWGEQCGYSTDVPMVPGYEVAAKTGTSSIVRSDGRGYEGGGTIGSVAGYAPAKNPRFAVLVKVDRPADLWGVQTAIPIYHSVVSKLLIHYRVPPDPALVADCQQTDMGQ